MLEELNGTTVTRKYTYGLSLISENQSIGGTATVSFYGFDGHGSVRQITDRNGALTDTYTYDAFGNILTTTGSTANNYKFAGEQFDPDLGLYYNRARYLDVRNGRFWGMDSEEGDPESPTSLHRYLYVDSDPINRIDPTGRETAFEALQSFTVNTTLQTLSISVPQRFIEAAVNVARGADLGTAALTAGLEVAGDVALSLALGGVLNQAARVIPIRQIGTPFVRAAESVWARLPVARGLAIEESILGRVPTFFKSNFPVIDDFFGGVATSIKSLDLTAASYETASALKSKLGQYAFKLSNFNGFANSLFEVAEEKIQERVLVVAFEEGAATAEQALALKEFQELAASEYPNIKILFHFIK